MICRHCLDPLSVTLMDLGFAPPSNAYLSEEQLLQPEQYFPLKVRACTSCWLVQTEDYAAAQDLFRSNYAYFSSTSSTWLEHARAYAQRMTKELQLDSGSFVIEVASNDGRFQGANATLLMSSFSFSRGVWNPSVLRGRSLSWSTIASIASSGMLLKLVPFG